MSERELIEPNEGDTRCIRRDENGQIEEPVDLNRSLSQDDRHDSKKTSKPGQGDTGDGHIGKGKPTKMPVIPVKKAFLRKQRSFLVK